MIKCNQFIKYLSTICIILMVGFNMSSQGQTASITTNSNVSCYGESDGQLTASATGGTSPYTYAWSNSSTSANISGLSAGTYTVTVTDGNSLTTTASSTITEPDLFKSHVYSTYSISCYGGSDAWINSNFTGGTTPYSYSWSTGATTQKIEDLSAGSYTVTATDANGCTATISKYFSNPSAITASIALNSNVSTNGGNDGQLTASASGGKNTTYTYSWSNNATSASISGLSAGTYTVTVYNSYGCTGTQTKDVLQPAAISITTNSNVSCNGESDGELTASASGSSSPYTYAWSNNATSANNSGLSAGTYTLTVTDANGLTSTASATITEPDLFKSHIYSTGSVSCHDGDNAWINSNFTGGTTPYSYSWSTGATTKKIEDLSAGSYRVTATDANGCTATIYKYFSNPSAISASIALNSNVSTNGGNDGQLTASASGGKNTTYTYSWSNNATSASISGLSAGTYTVTVYNSYGCTGTKTQEVLQPASISITSSGNLSCNGDSDGQLTASASGSTSPYTYSWSNSATTAAITGLSAGTYTVTVTDGNGLTSAESATITEPNLFENGIYSTNSVSCNGGNNAWINSNFTGGTTPYSYSWSTGATTQKIEDLSAGTYTVTATDANGCTATITKYFSNPSAISASIALNSNVSTNGGNDGQLTASASGGKNTTYTYSWSNSATTTSISGLSAGTYTVTVYNSYGCTGTQSIDVLQPAALSITSGGNLSCNGDSDGQLTASASGSSSPYTYAWSNSATSAAITSLSAGTYTLTVTDGNGLTVSASETITEPATLAASIAVNSQVSTYNGSDGQLTVSASGGTANYTYNWSNSATTASISNLVAGTYTVSITDANGCSITKSETVTQPAANPEIALYGNGVEIIDGDATPDIKDHTYFGSVDATSATKTRTFTITNSGTSDLTLSGSPKVAVSGTNSADFTISSQPSSSSISTSASLTFVVEFDPSADGLREATLTITSDDSDEGTYDFAISGLGSSKADYPFDWTWYGGSSTKDPSGVYGTKGTASSSNVPGGRRNAFSCIDQSGNIYLFGGYGLDKNGDEGFLNDLWKYDGSQWTWLSGSDTRNATGVYGTKGTAASTNIPGARFGAVGYIDANGNLWMFSGEGFYGSSSTGNLNDLWKWDGSNWTWIGGHNNVDQVSNYGTTGQYSSSSWPRGAHESASWYDGNGIFWMLGGYGRDNNNQGGQLNDLWKWNGSQWAFVGGSKTRKPAGKYTTGTLWPGGRRYGAQWVDASNNLWLFGGHGADKTTVNGYLNDLWKYDGSQWTWVSGDDDKNQFGSFGSQGNAAASNVPGGRRRCAYWVDASGNMTLYGGYGYDASGNLGELNDMWTWDGSNWAWTSGEKTYQQAGNFGTLSTSSSDNYPGAKYAAGFWLDQSGNLWMMGGQGTDANGALGYSNDLWKMDMSFVWDGSSTTWGTNSNWKHGGVPSTSYSVKIPNGLSTYPSLSSDISLKSLEIESGASLSIASGKTLTITDAFSYAGSSALNLGDGTLKFAGTSAQTIDGKINGNVEIDNASDVSLGASSTINSLTLTNGDLDLGSSDLSLGSASGGSASSYVKISGTGRVSMEVGSNPVTFPIGRNPYEPIIIDDGGSATYSVGLTDSAFTNPATKTGHKTSLVVGETWNIQASTAQNGVSVTLQWDENQEETSFDRANCMIGYWENGVSSVWNAQGTNAAASGSDPYTQSRTIDFSTNLYYFGVGSNGSALPAELTYFTAQWQEVGKSAQLNWATAMEENNSHFEIERSLDGQVWEQIGRVEGAGNSIATHSYQFIDNGSQLTDHSSRSTVNRELSTVYYRLKQMDYNGAYEYSETRTLNSEQETRNSISLYPNPTSDWLNVESNSHVEKITVYSLQGKQVLESIGASRIDLASLLPGQYIIEICSNNNITQRKIMVN